MMRAISPFSMIFLPEAKYPVFTGFQVFYFLVNFMSSTKRCCVMKAELRHSPMHLSPAWGSFNSSTAMKTPNCDRLQLRTILLLLLVFMLHLSCEQDDPVLSSDKTITEFSFLAANNETLSADVHAVITGEEIHCTVPAGTSVTSLKPTIVHTGDFISPASGVPKNFSNVVSYTVTAKDNSTQTYEVSVTVLPPVLSSDKSITSFAFLSADNPGLSYNVVGTISGQNILCTVPAGVSVVAMKPTIVLAGSSVNPASGVANNFTTPATYTVTAQDGTTADYTVTVSVTDSEPSVYVVGGQRFSGTFYARVWKDGIGTNLTNGTYNAAASSVFVKNDVLYAAGYQTIGGSVATYWKLENETQVTTTALNETVNEAYANSIYVSDNNDAYVAGQENHGGGVFIAKVWKNGQATHLTSGTSAVASSVFTSGADVYVAGWESSAAGTVAKVWKNGVGTALSPDNGNAHANAVFVSSGNVYVAGQSWNGSTWVMQVWKNGVPESITNTGSVDISGMFVSDGDVYVVGDEIRNDIYNAKIWKNGVGTFLSEVSGSHAQSVYAHNGDVYAAGWENNNQGQQMAVLWKNGVATPLAANAFAYAVIVK
jgi:hypothetical protein